jgi:mRNA-degrading endonuclease HigB of HigAB toxin-antitoxin module
LTLKRTKAFDALLSKLEAKGKISRAEVENALDLYIQDNKSPELRPHWIECKKNQKLLSLSIPNQSFRILATVGCKPKISIFHFIGTHKEYDVIIKNQKNCKHITHNCDEAKNMPCYEKNDEVVLN